MPMHLLPISRRSFLGGAVAAGAGWLRLRAAAADAAAPDLHTFALFSDTHISHKRDAVHNGTNMFANFAQARAEVLALPQRPAGLLISGDCAFLDGQSGDYGALLELVQPLTEAGLPLHLMLGNHDHRERFWQALPDEKRQEAGIDNKQVSVVPAERANWFLLDSLEKTNVTPGSLGPEQLRWLGKALDAHPEKPAIVVAHHNPIPGGLVQVGLNDTKALLEQLAPRRHVKAYIFGHTHLWNVGQYKGIHLVNLPPVAYPFQRDNPSGWVQVKLAENGASLELRSLNREHRLHGQRIDLAWRTM